MVAVLLLLLATAAFADSPGTHGQPSQSCEDPATSTTPGNAGNPSNTGSPFSPNGTSGGVYADRPGTGGGRTGRRPRRAEGGVELSLTGDGALPRNPSGPTVQRLGATSCAD
jgi:hypothetical protein